MASGIFHGVTIAAKRAPTEAIWWRKAPLDGARFEVST